MIDDSRLPERFWAKVSPEPNTGCWLWTAGTNQKGYGLYREISTLPMRTAHRMTYRAFRGAVPVGLELDHRCRTPACCNPDHLEAVTHQVNVARGRVAEANRARREAIHCRQGHAFDDNNTIHEGGRRRCRACRNSAQRRRWAVNHTK